MRNAVVFSSVCVSQIYVFGFGRPLYQSAHLLNRSAYYMGSVPAANPENENI